MIGAQAALCLNPKLERLVIPGLSLQRDSEVFALWAAIAGRVLPTQLVLGFNGMSVDMAEYWAHAFFLLQMQGSVEVFDETGRKSGSEQEIQASLTSTPAPWIVPRLLDCLLADPTRQEGTRAARPGLAHDGSSASPTYAADGPARPDKFKSEPVEMVFDDESAFKDGIYGLYKRRGLDPDRLQRSMRQEFEQNERGRWLAEFECAAAPAPACHLVAGRAPPA